MLSEVILVLSGAGAGGFIALLLRRRAKRREECGFNHTGAEQYDDPVSNSEWSTWIDRRRDLQLEMAFFLDETNRQLSSEEDVIKAQRSTRLWDLGGLLFDHRTRSQIYEPVINEIREDFLLARRASRSAANHRWVNACFAIRGSLAFLRCLRICILRPVTALIPPKLRQLWKLFS